MNKVTEILEKIKKGIPVALSRFNDGECGIILNSDFVAARGDQKGTVELQAALIDAIKHEQKNYYKGYPCPVCMSRIREDIVINGYYTEKYPYNTLAVVNTNRNLTYFKSSLIKNLHKKHIVWVSGKDQDLSFLNGSNIFLVKHIKVKRKNSWARYEDVYQECENINRPGYVFLFSLGPTSRVLVKNLFEVYPDSTFIDIGSTFDPETRNVSHKCHKGTLKPCKGCN